MHRKGARKLDAGETGNCSSYPGHRMRSKLILFWKDRGRDEYKTECKRYLESQKEQECNQWERSMKW